jgi:hypothetical protein
VSDSHIFREQIVVGNLILNDWSMFHVDKTKKMSFFSLPHDHAASEPETTTAEPAEKKQKILVEYDSSDSENEQDDGSKVTKDSKVLWKSQWSEEQRSFYYFCPETGESAWELPPNGYLEGSNNISSLLDLSSSAADDNNSSGDDYEFDYVQPFLIDPLVVVVSGCSKTEAATVLKQCGEIVAVFQDNECNAKGVTVSRNWCFKFAHEKEASDAMLLNGHETAGKRIEVSRHAKKNFTREDQPNKLFMRQLPRGVSNSEIEAFLGHPVIHVYRIHLKDTTTTTASKVEGAEGEKLDSGMAIVTLRSPREVQDAVATKNGLSLLSASTGESSVVHIKMSSRRMWEGVSSQQSADVGDENSKVTAGNSLTVWIGGLRKDCDEDSAQHLFAGCGELKSFRFIKDRLDGDCKGFAFAQYQSKEGAVAAVSLNGQSRLGTKLKVRYAVDRSA